MTDLPQPDPARPLAGRVALVTGSTRNIGLGIALAFARAGAALVLNGLSNAGALGEALAAARALGAEAAGVLADVSDPTAVARLVGEADSRFGRVDIAVSCAGLRLREPFAEVRLESWRRVLATNLDAAFLLDRLVLPGMAARGWGRILHISGYDGFSGQATSRPHNIAAKAGLHGLTKAVAVEYGRRGVTANTVVPGFIETERDPARYPRLAERRADVVRRTCVGRTGTVDDVAQACVYLASDAASFVTGAALHVNGGEYMV